jgi:hypothetical protein
MKPPWQPESIHAHWLPREADQQMLIAPPRQLPLALAELSLMLTGPKRPSKRSRPMPPSEMGQRYLLSVVHRFEAEADGRKAVAQHNPSDWYRYVDRAACAFIAAAEETNPRVTDWFYNFGPLADFLFLAIKDATSVIRNRATVAQQAKKNSSEKGWSTTLAEAREDFRRFKEKEAAKQ